VRLSRYVNTDERSWVGANSPMALPIPFPVKERDVA